MEYQFNKPRRTPNELPYISKVIDSGALVGGGLESLWCENWLKNNLATSEAILTTSATDALELAAILLDLSPGDEVILPSYTFVSSANAFVLRGAVPVFIDIHKENLNMDESQIEAAISPRTKAIVVVHYGGNPCNMDEIMRIASLHNLIVIEDAAQAILSEYRGKYLGTIGHLGVLSFHGTKNVVCGEGGAILINDQRFIDRAHIASEKGTNRKKFVAGKVDKYSWVDVGSSFLASEVTAAYLHSQLENAQEINNHRMETCFAIDEMLNDHLDLLDSNGVHKLPLKSANGHMFPLVFPDYKSRESFIEKMAEGGFQCVSHYTALHSSVAGLKYGKTGSSMTETVRAAEGLVRLPIWSDFGLPTERLVDTIVTTLKSSNLES